MHILNMPLIFQEKLNRANIGLMLPKVLMYVKGFKILSFIGGKYQYDTTETETHCFDLTKAVKNDSIVISKTIPELPTFDGAGSLTQYSNVKLQIQKMYGSFWQYVGQGAGITRLQDSSVEISLSMADMPDLLQFKGGIKTSPKEEFDSVTFDVRSSMWDIVGRELQTNQYNTSAIAFPGTGVITEAVNTYTGVTTPSQRLTYHSPIITFNELAQSRGLVKASDASNVDLIEVALHANKPAKLGKYTLKWLNDTTVEFTTPTTGTNVLTHGSITAPTTSLTLTLPTALSNESGLINITVYVSNPQAPAAYVDIKGKTIEFWLAYTVEGNPISIVLDMLVRSISGDWNTSAAITLDPNLPINYSIFQEMEDRFDFTTLYVSEWNKENDVYSYKNDTKPIQVKNIAQKILDHIGCQLTYDTEGKISINTNWFYNDSNLLWRLGSIHCGVKGTGFVPSHSVDDGKVYKRMEVFYAENSFTGESAGFYEKNAPDSLVGIYGVNDKPEAFKASLPYFKLGVSDLLVSAIVEYLWKWVQVSHIRLSATILPQFGASLDVGDKFIADFTTEPILPNTDKGWGKYFMIYGINKKIGGEVEIQAIATPEPILPAKWCEAKWCIGGSRWK